MTHPAPVPEASLARDLPLKSRMRTVVPALALALVVAGCSSPRDEAPQAGAQLGTAAEDLQFEQIANEDVQRLMRLSPDLYSGGEPKTEESFRELAALGVKTIVNVDGATPKLDLAAKYGMEYVHIPIGYDGVKPEQAAAMVRVMREREGPYYFHCHHGRHRGPAAAAIALMESTGCSTDGGVAVLEQAGTSEGYPGLWRDVRAFQPPPADAELPELVEVAEVGDFEAAMAQLDRTWDEMKLIQKAGFVSSADHPDLDPHNVARILAQRLEESRKLSDPTLAAEERYHREMMQAVRGAHALEEALSEGRIADAQAPFDEVRKSCKGCHVDYRDD